MCVTTEELLRLHEKLPHRAHQLIGVEALLQNPYFLLADEVGAGKSKQVVDTSQIFWLRKIIDTMLVVTPGFARSTWAEEDPLLGEVALHAWDAVPNVIHEYHKTYTDLALVPGALNWVVTNYEFIRREDRLYDLAQQMRGRHTWLVLDESWAIKGNSDQMRACRSLRNRRADRVVELNGTPLADGKPTDLYYPMSILDPSILGVKNKTHFRSKYCVMGGYMNKQVVSYQNLDDLNQRIAPYVLSRRTRDCFDLPPMLPPVTIEARLSPSTWKIYTDMRDEMVSFVGSQASVSKQAIVRMLRLSQITSGYLGGLEEVEDDYGTRAPQDEQTNPFGAQPAWLRRISGEQETPIQSEAPSTIEAGLATDSPDQCTKLPASTGPLTREISREKADAFIHWLDTFGVQPAKLLVWCRFTKELERTSADLRSIYPAVFQLKGGQSKDERRAAKEALAPRSTVARAAVVGNQKAGGASLNFAGASVAVYLSNGPALIERTQSVGRIERPGATQPMLIVDVVATGPKGQKTVDHATLKALRGKDDMAQWTVQQWRNILSQI